MNNFSDVINFNIKARVILFTLSLGSSEAVISSLCGTVEHMKNRLRSLQYGLSKEESINLNVVKIQPRIQMHKAPGGIEEAA